MLLITHPPFLSQSLYLLNLPQCNNGVFDKYTKYLNNSALFGNNRYKIHYVIMAYCDVFIT